MITATATKSILLKQEDIGGGLKKDVRTKRGEKMQLTETDAIKFWGAFKFSEKDEKSLLKIAKTNEIKRII